MFPEPLVHEPMFPVGPAVENPLPGSALPPVPEDDDLLLGLQDAPDALMSFDRGLKRSPSDLSVRSEPPSKAVRFDVGQEPLTGGSAGSAPSRPRPSTRPLSTLPPAFVETSDGLSIPDEPFQEPPLALVNRSALRIVTLPAVLDLLSQQEDALPCFEDSCSDDDFVSQHAHLVYATSGESPPNLPCPQRQTSESDSDEGDKGPLMTRQQQKALDRELPWRTILSKDKSYVAEFEKAIKKEETSWRDWGSVRPLTPQEVKQVMTDPVLRKRIIPSRAVYRDKNIGVPPLKAKCRVVAAGFKDPDLAQLPRFAPTASRVAFHTVLQVASTGQLEDPPWKLASADVSTAFLQGKGSDRQLPLYLRTPQEETAKKAEKN